MEATQTQSNTFSTNITIRNSRPFSATDGMIFIICVLSSFYVRIMGQLYLSEISLLILLPVLLRERGKSLVKFNSAFMIVALGGIWFVGQIISDIVNNSAIEDILRGWAAIIFFLIDFIAIYLLIFPSKKRITIAILGLATGILLSTIFQPPAFFEQYPWKFGYAYPVTLLILLLVTWLNFKRAQRIIGFLFMVGLGVFSIYMDFRSLGGMVILAGFIYWLVHLLKTKKGKRISIAGFLGIGIVSVLAIYFILTQYLFMVQSGVLGQTALHRFAIQFSNIPNLFTLILGGRTQLIPSLYAIADSPLLGHGSWAHDARYRLYLYNILDWGVGNIEYLDYNVRSSDLIPTHSIIFQAWVWAGLAGFVFWAYILWINGKSIISAIRKPDYFLPLVLSVGLIGAWDILFSPFGSIMRFRWALFLVIFLVQIYPVQKTKQYAI
jgi:hypothetical protein